MADKPVLITRARTMRKEPSRAESALWDILRGRNLHGAKFRRQHPIASYIADFACIEAKLIIEIDGLSHRGAEQQAYDAQRTEALNAEGWRVLRLRDADVLADASAAAAQISKALHQ